MSHEFSTAIKALGEKAIRIRESLKTEEATKTALILPFIHALGYDIFDPTEVVPEFDAEVAKRIGYTIDGKKKNEKIDYAILKDGKPIMLIECKNIDKKPDDHFGQLFRYFQSLEARFAILTNGVQYQFFTDLDKPNVMDNKPFLEIDITELRDAYIKELGQFSKSNFNVDSILSAANELKLTTVLKEYLRQEFDKPSESFIRFLLKQESIYSGPVTQKIIEQFNPIVRNSIAQIISDQIADRLRNALVIENQAVASITNTPVVASEAPITAEDVPDDAKVVTTPEELEAFYIVKSILRKVLDPQRIFYRDAQSYFSVLVDNNNRKPVCRLHLNANKRRIGILDENKKETQYELKQLDDIYGLIDALVETAQRYA